MTHTINELPTPSDFGTTFNYAVWTPNTVVKLCNVPWNSDYRDIVRFSDHATLESYIDNISGPSVTVGKMTLARAGDPIRLNLPFNACYKYNYIRVSNPTLPITAHYTDDNGVNTSISDSPKVLYYFIMSVDYIAPNTTQLTIQLDVWQTFNFSIAFGNCYIEQGHIGVANSNQFNNKGRDYLTVPEGLEIGEEYCVNQTWATDLKTSKIPGDPQDNERVLAHPWVVMGIAADVTADPGDTTKPNLSLYNPDSTGTENLPNGFDVLIFPAQELFMNFIANFAKTPWITQTIQFITLIPPINASEDNFKGVQIWNTDLDSAWVGAPVCYRYYNSTNGFPGVMESYDMTVANVFRDWALSFIPDRYKYLKKLLVYPYCLFEITTYNATPLILKPELIPDDDVNVEIYQHVAPPNPRWAIVPLHYNATGTEGNHVDGEFLDFATYISNFPQFTVMNNGYLQYLGSNAASIAYQERSANWGQQKALHGASTAYENVGSGTQATSRFTANQIRANNDRLAISQFNGAADAGGDLIGAVASGGATAPSLIGDTAGFFSRSMSNTVANNLATSNATVGIAQASQIGANNYAYAQFAARGDYQNAIAGIQAQVSNAKMLQPSSVGQMGGEAFFVSIDNAWKIYGKLKQINPGMMAVIGEYWLRYGYAINRFGNISTLKVMSKFTYWKLKETYITSSQCPEIFKQTIRGIFEKGVTVWNNPDDIGNIDIASNIPLSGISL